MNKHNGGEQTDGVRYIFGPVPSRRLGISLGIDVVPFKTCTLNCIYCECGETTRLTLERSEFVAPDVILHELRGVLEHASHIDYLTFSGAGEPTLNSSLGGLIAEIKKISQVPVAVLTNGTLLFREDVRADLLSADVVLPSLDAVSDEVFSRINRPHPKLDAARILDGLKTFRDVYRGQIWLEVFIVKGINDGDDELDRLHGNLLEIRAEKIHLNSLDRPPAVPGVEPVALSVLEEIREKWEDLPVDVAKRAGGRNEILSFSRNLENNILNTISRRPLTVDDLIRLTGKNRLEILKYIDVLESEKKISTKIVGDKIFYARLK